MIIFDQLTKDLWNASREKCPVNQEYCGIVWGDSGLLPVLSKLYELTHDEYYPDLLFCLLDELLREPKSDFTLGNGVAGLAWCFSRIDGEWIENGQEWLLELEDSLIPEYESLIKKREWDYFSGATGLLVYFLTGPVKNQKLEQMIGIYLLGIREELKQERFYRLLPNLQTGKFSYLLNLGTPHGVTGVLLTLLMIKERGYSVEKELVDDIIHLLFSYRIKNVQKSGYYFPGKVEKEGLHYPSGLAWCYGDLMAGYAILKAGCLYDDFFYKQSAEAILDHTLLSSVLHTQNLILCHGYSSLSIVYDQIFELTREKKYQVCSFHYLKEMETAFEHAWKESGKTKEYNYFFESPALLYGFSGYILTQLYWKEGYKEWINCLLL